MTFKNTKLISKGDHFSVGEELLSGVSEIELKCNAVKDAVKGKYFTLSEALQIYKVSEKEYNEFIENL